MARTSAVPGRLSALLAAAVVLGLLASALLVRQQTEATLASSAGNSGNSWATGNVNVGDNDAGGALFNASNLQPAATGTRCITVSYSGSVNSTIRLYAASVSGSTALANDLQLTISTSPVASAVSDPTCANSYTWTQAWTGSLTAFNGYTSYTNLVCPGAAPDMSPCSHETPAQPIRDSVRT